MEVPHGVVQCRSLDVRNSGVQLRTTYNERCGCCVEVCPEGAIELIIESDAIYEETMERLASPVDVE